MVFSLFQQDFKFIFTFACRLYEVKTNVMWMSRNLQIFCSQVSKYTQMCLQMYIACIEFYVLWPSERRIQSDKMRAVTFFFSSSQFSLPIDSHGHFSTFFNMHSNVFIYYILHAYAKFIFSTMRFKFLL